MTIHGVLKKFDTWCDIIRLSSLRLTLAEGFHAHMCRNETVREIFGIDDPIKEQTMSGSKKAVSRLFSCCLSFRNPLMIAAAESER